MWGDKDEKKKKKTIIEDPGKSDSMKKIHDLSAHRDHKFLSQAA